MLVDSRIYCLSIGFIVSKSKTATDQRRHPSSNAAHLKAVSNTVFQSPLGAIGSVQLLCFGLVRQQRLSVRSRNSRFNTVFGCGGEDSNLRSTGYEPVEMPLLYPALNRYHTQRRKSVECYTAVCGGISTTVQYNYSVSVF